MDPNHPIMQEILDDQDDTAADETSTARETYEGAPALAQALEAIAAPDESDDDDQIESAGNVGVAPEQPDWQAQLADRDARLQQLELEKQRVQQERDQQLMADAARAWQMAEQQAIQQASQAQSWDDAQQMLVGFYRQREASLTQAAQQQIRTAYTGAYIEDVARKTGLSDEDKAIIASLPAESVPAVANALRAKNAQLDSRLSDIQKELTQLKRGRQSQRRAMTGVDRPAGTPSRPASSQTFVPGGTAHTLAILELSQMAKERNRR
jgi:hypothetical protein